jgi:hypothetical protein
MNFDFLAPWHSPREQRHYFAKCSSCDWESSDAYSEERDCEKECPFCGSETTIGEE